MPFLKYIAVTLVVGVGSFVTATLGFFHVPTANDRTLPGPSVAVQITPSPNTTVASTSLPKIISARKDEITGTAPIKDARVYQAIGYSIGIPSSFIYGIAPDSLVRLDYGNNPPANQDTWYSPDESQVIWVQWEPDSPNSQIRRLEETQLFYADLAKTKPQMAPVAVSHPAIKGAATTSVMLEKPISPAGSYGIYLFVTGDNGNIYLIYGVSSAATARTSVKQIVESFSF